MAKNNKVLCSFCGKDNTQVKMMLSSKIKAKTFICSFCVIEIVNMSFNLNREKDEIIREDNLIFEEFKKLGKPLLAAKSYLDELSAKIKKED